MTRSKADDRKKAELIAAELVACIDGPMINQWFYLDEWHARRDAALAMGHGPHDVAGAVLGYVPVRGETIGNPTYGAEVIGAVLAYAPDVAAAAMHRKSA